MASALVARHGTVCAVAFSGSKAEDRSASKLRSTHSGTQAIKMILLSGIRAAKFRAVRITQFLRDPGFLRCPADAIVKSRAERTFKPAQGMNSRICRCRPGF